MGMVTFVTYAFCTTTFMARGIKSKADRLAEYRRVREQGGRSKQWKVSLECVPLIVLTLRQEEVVDALYDEVSEDEYRNVVKTRLDRDDFVVDDGVDGYADNGMDDWDVPSMDSDEEADGKSKPNGEPESLSQLQPVTKRSTVKKKAKVAKPVKPIPPPTLAAYRPAPSAAKEEDFLAGILGNLNKAVPYPFKGDTVPRKRKPEHYTRSSSPDTASFGDSSFTQYPSSDPLDTPSDIEDAPLKALKRQRTSSDAAAPTIDRLSQLKVDNGPVDSEYDRFFDDPPMDVDANLGEPSPVTLKAELVEPDLHVPTGVEERSSAQPAWLSLHASLKVAGEDKLDALAPAPSNRIGPRPKILEDDNSLHLFWFDYLEMDGKVHLVGKARDRTSGTWVSCCLTVEGIQRNLFILPRGQGLGGSRDNAINLLNDHTEYGAESGEPPTDDEVEADFTAMRKQSQVRSCGMKWVTRNYAFGDKNIPVGESRWLKVVYGFDREFDS